jgi:hypothetical protein
MKRLSWKYLAGLIDGEGCLDLAMSTVGGKRYIRPRLRIAMTTPGKDVLDMCQANFGGHMHTRTPENLKWDTSYTWSLTGYKLTCMFLRNVVNHMYIKQEQARFLLWMETSTKGKPVSDDITSAIRKELAAMKHDPHRLSEKAAESINILLKR